jgi:hypothetical protein
MRLATIIACTLWITIVGIMPAINLGAKETGERSAEKRVALIIGNGAYAHAPHLANPTHDADAVAAALERVGFETTVGLDLDQAGMQDAAIRFARAARTADVALFYYSGHAMQISGVNYLVPIDAELRDEADLRRMVRVDEILADLQHAKNLRILVLDSCRHNPLADQLKRSIGLTRGASIGQGLAKMESPDGTIISYATQAGRTAQDGTGRNSPYTTAFLNHIQDKEEIATVFHQISANVYETTKGTQVPELSLSFFGEFYLNGKLQLTVKPSVPTAPADACAAAESHWKSAEAIGSVAAFEDHLAKFPNCTFAELAKARIESLKNKVATVAPVPPAISPIAPTISTFHDQLITRLVAMSVGKGEAEIEMGEYIAQRGHKAIVVAENGLVVMKSWGRASEAISTRDALETCQVYWGKPCTLAAVDYSIEATGGVRDVPRDMPRTQYAGLFEPGQIPGEENLLYREDVSSYRSKSGPKAVAYHPIANSRIGLQHLFIVVGGTDQVEAEQMALAQCNDDHKGKWGLCFIYAIGDQVVLPKRLVNPLSQRGTPSKDGK